VAASEVEPRVPADDGFMREHGVCHVGDIKDLQHDALKPSKTALIIGIVTNCEEMIVIQSVHIG